jgi:hypothetical protein
VEAADSAGFASFFGAAAALARALSLSLSLELPNDPRVRLPFSVLLSPRPIGGSFHPDTGYFGLSKLNSVAFLSKNASISWSKSGLKRRKIARRGKQPPVK